MNRITLLDECDFLDWRQGSGHTIEIFDIQVGSERGKGKGTRLVQKLMAHLPEGTRLVWALTRSDNQNAQRFYEKLDFRVVAVLRDFYRDVPRLRGSMDAIMYGRSIGADE